MQEDRFWELVGKLRIGAQNRIPRMKRLLARALAQMTDGEVAGFADRWREVNDRADCWPLWEAVVVAFGGCSDDGFMDVHAWLICQGRFVYTAVIAEPDSLLEYVGPAGGEVFGDAEGFSSVIWDEFYGRPHTPGFTRHQPLGRGVFVSIFRTARQYTPTILAVLPRGRHISRPRCRPSSFLLSLGPRSGYRRGP